MINKFDVNKNKTDSHKSFIEKNDDSDDDGKFHHNKNDTVYNYISE